MTGRRSEALGDGPATPGLGRRPLVAAAVAVALALGACGGDGKDSAGTPGDRIRVVASFYPMAEAASRVGGERVEVTNLTPAGVEPHDIELSSRQVDRLEDADLLVYLGNGFQPAVEKVAERRSTGTLDVLSQVELDDGATTALENEEDVDPHFWLDPTLMARAADAVSDALAELSPTDAELFSTNAERYKEQLLSLDAELQRGLTGCRRSQIVTAHAAFFYLARRYGLTQLAIAGLSPEAEPDAARLGTLTDEIRAKGITTVFYEDLVSPKVSRALAREAGVKTAVLSPIEGLSKDEAAAGKDYAAVMRNNLAALRDALGCP
jgi:zinc transport system substrate-binding protein